MGNGKIKNIEVLKREVDIPKKKKRRGTLTIKKKK